MERWQAPVHRQTRSEPLIYIPTCPRAQGRWGFFSLQMKSILILLLLLIINRLAGQVNLVPNPGFDTISSCPVPHGDKQITKAFPWFSATTSGIPELFNACANSPSVCNVPNPFGCNYIPAKTGNGYSGISIYARANNIYKGEGGGEYLEVPLIHSIPKGSQCYIRFFVAPDEDCYIGQDYFFTDAIGLALSDTLVLMDIPANQPQVLPLKPVIENRGKIIKDTSDWTKVSVCYKAKGGEKYAIIGNFRTDAETLKDYVKLSIPHPENYAFIDDVLISPFNPLPDTLVLCNGSPQTLNASFWEATYHWNTGSTDSMLTVSTPGTYSVQAFIDSCVLYDTMVVIDSRDKLPFQADTTICRGDSLLLAPLMPGAYLWSDGFTQQKLKVQNPGLYSVTVTNHCGQFSYSSRVNVRDCGCNIYVPSAFSPNGDGVNDMLKVFPGCDFDIHVRQFCVFDRWGNNVFMAASMEDISWDGTYKGKVLSPGPYAWLLEYDIIQNGNMKRKLDKGEVVIVR